MTGAPFTDPLTRDLLGDAEIAALLSDAAAVRAMLLVEGALARVQGAMGVIPEAAAAAIERAAREAEIDPARLGPATARDGLPVPALVRAFRDRVAEPWGAFVHHGATSQDILDTGLVLRLRRILDILGERTDALLAALADAAERHRGTVMAARTRSQVATPTTFGLRIALWGDPLLRARDRLREMRPRLLAVSLGGASGTLAAFGGRGIETAERLAAELGLAAPLLPWHAARDRFAELGAWAAMLAGALGKMGTDLVLLGRSEAAEAAAGAAGGSSTMPHKANPTGAEALVALSREAASRAGLLLEALVHAEERDGAGLLLEALALPPLLLAAAAATRHGLALAGTIRADAGRMAATITATGGTMFAEAATFALAARMPRPAAEALVKRAMAEAGAEGFPARLRALADVPVDWEAVFDPARQTGEAAALADRFVAAVRQRG